MSKTIWRFDLNSIIGGGGGGGERHALGTYQDTGNFLSPVTACTSARHDMQNIMRATLHKSGDIFTIFLTHNHEGLSNVSLVL